ncbi:zinc ribbon domain-containing protein [Chloroflexota bacterium]
MNNTKRILMVLLLTGLLFFTVGKSFVLAQGDNEPTGLDNVELFIYPEYDDPRLLVMLEGHIDGIEAPATVRFLVPENAQMYSAGSMDTQGVYTGGPPDREPSELPGWDEISYEVTSDTFRIEYYDPIILGNPDKSISYDFHFLYPISELNVVIQQPRTAVDFTVVPATEQSRPDNEGLNSFFYVYENLESESPLHFDITYHKSDQQLSVDTNGSTSEEESNNAGTILAIFTGTILVLGALGFIWFQSRTPRSRAERRRSKTTSAPRSPAGKAKTKYCTQCGKPVNNSYKFCPGCGAEVP